MLFSAPLFVLGHSGRTDSSGGHNCRVGSCAGTYHYHNGGPAYTAPRVQGDPNVKILQEKLNYLFEGNPVTVDGVYGSNTKRAVEIIQGQEGLYVDGVVGEDTINAILRLEREYKSYESPYQDKVISKTTSNIAPVTFNDESDESSGAGWITAGLIGLGGYYFGKKKRAT